MTPQPAAPAEVERRLRRILTDNYQSAVTRGDLVEVILLIHKALEDALAARLDGDVRALSFAAKARRAVPAWAGELEQLDRRRRAIAHPNVLLHRAVARLAEDYVELVLRRWLILIGGDDPPPAVIPPVAVRRLTARPAPAAAVVPSLAIDDAPTAPLPELRATPPAPAAGSRGPSRPAVTTAPLVPFNTMPLPELRAAAGSATAATAAPPTSTAHLLPAPPSWPMLLLGFGAGLLALALLGAARALGNELAARDLWALPVVALALVAAGIVALLALRRAARAGGPLPAAGVAALLALLVAIPSAVESAAPLSPLALGRRAASRLATTPAVTEAPRPPGAGGLPAAPTFTPPQPEVAPRPDQPPVVVEPPSPVPVAGAPAILPGGRVYVGTADGARLNGRAEPGLDAVVVAVYEPGEMLTVVEGPVQADDRQWWRVRGASGEGWCAAEFLLPAP